MKIFVISLKRTPWRLEKFAQSNPHIEYTVFDAVDGQDASRPVACRSGTATNDASVPNAS